MSPTAIAKKKVLAVHPAARLYKSNISSWGVGVSPSLWLSHGEPTSYLAWQRAARYVLADSAHATDRSKA